MNKLEAVPSFEEVIKVAEEEFDIPTYGYPSWNKDNTIGFYEEIASFMLGDTEERYLEWEGIEYYINDKGTITSIDDGWMVPKNRGKEDEISVAKVMAYYVFSNFIDEGTPMHMKSELENNMNEET